MPRLTAVFSLRFTINLSRTPCGEANKWSSLQELLEEVDKIGIKAVISNRHEGLLWIPFDLSIKDKRISITIDAVKNKFDVMLTGSFTSSRLREGVAPFIQSKMKECELTLSVEALRLIIDDGEVHEIYTHNLAPAAQLNALSWRLH